MKIPYKAEKIAGWNTNIKGFSAERIKVINGWIVRHVAWDNEMKCLSESSVFVPDANHYWKINE